jgi:hypothetical protein
VGHIEITVNEFTSVFKGDDYSPKMISVLNAAVHERVEQEKRREEERIKSRI